MEKLKIRFRGLVQVNMGGSSPSNSTVVNDELKSLELALYDAFSLLSPGGRFQVISLD